jgi:cation diffusion facilitator CzcD-associated flavoprotein CzcO/amino acid transporter
MDESLRATARQFESGKHRRVLSTQRIVFLVVAAAAPLAAMIGTLPIAIARGNGAGVPGAFLLATLTLFCFAAGYAAISRRIVSTGAFFTYVAQGLGKPAGVGAAFVAMVAYVGVTLGLAAFFGYFLELVLTPAGIHLPWYLYATVGMATVAFLGYRSIDLSSRILGALMAVEIAVLAIFDTSVLVSRGIHALPLASFAPHALFTPGLAVALMFAFTSFIGFESAALYGEEAKEPRKSIPTATFVSVFLIGGFYMLTAWITIGAMGPGPIRPAAEKAGSMLMFDLITRFSGQAVSDITAILVCTSLLASYLALHNAASRYIFALAREKLLFKPLGEFHPARYAPSNASLAVSAITVACVLGFAASGLDPYKAGIPVLIGVGTLGIIILQAFAGIAIVAWLSTRKGVASRGVFVASIVGAAGLVIASILVSVYFPLLASADLPFVAWLPLIYPLMIVAGIALAFWLRAHRPGTYANLASVALRADSSRRIPARAQFKGRYCIVGAGPCGLVTARAFKRAGIPYDQFERHGDVGGIWDIDNPGSPMYESAHFISSRYTSGFFGFPMPEAYPDYPGHQQILAYVRDFADAFDLKSGVTFGTEVRHAEPLGEGASDGWKVTLSNGETRHYEGIICANGVTWHPNLPDYPDLDRFEGETLHTVDYRDPDLLRGKRVLIVGAGNSGVDIACDAARHARSACISVRRGYRFVPKHIFGVPTDVFLLGQVHPPKGVVVPDDPTKMLDVIVGDLTRYGLPKPDHKALESHPIMNTQILHHLAHGDLKARGDVVRFTPGGAVFADGSEEAFDLVLFATGYRWEIPYLDRELFSWKPGGHPELYLNIFHRTLRGLSVVGFVELASAGYKRFDEIAQMAAMDAWLDASDHELDEWTRMKAGHQPNLKGGKTYVDSPRHENYVDADVFRRTLSEVREKFGWPDPDDHFYAHMRMSSGNRELGAHD